MDEVIINAAMQWRYRVKRVAAIGAVRNATRQQSETNVERVQERRHIRILCIRCHAND